MGDNGKTIRWGILGSGKICSDFGCAVRSTPGCELYGVAARARSSAQEYANKVGASHVFDSYQELAACPEVDIVYVGTWHTLHEEHVLLCLAHGKNVLVEKPLAMSAGQARRMVSAARRAKRFLMEGHWTRFFPATLEALKAVRSGAIGDVVSVYADFNYFFPPDASKLQFQPSMGGGALLEIGCYPIAAAFCYLGGKPIQISAVGATDNGVDVSASLAMRWPGGRVACLGYGYLGESAEETTIVGSTGRVVLRHPGHCPTAVSIITRQGSRGNFNVDRREFDLPKLAPGLPKLNFPNSEGMVYECAAVSQCVRRGETECVAMPLDESVAITEVLDEVRRQLGVSCPQVSKASRLAKHLSSIGLLLGGVLVGIVISRAMAR